MAAPKRPLSRIKILEESPRLVLNFCNGQKVVETPQDQEKKYEKRRVREKSIPEERHDALVKKFSLSF